MDTRKKIAVNQIKQNTFFKNSTLLQGVSPLRDKSNSSNTRICVIIHENFIRFH